VLDKVLRPEGIQTLDLFHAMEAAVQPLLILAGLARILNPWNAGLLRDGSVYFPRTSE
jgi:hypothetical protein